MAKLTRLLDVGFAQGDSVMCQSNSLALLALTSSRTITTGKLHWTYFKLHWTYLKLHWTYFK